jgi:hypothetical protein
MPDESWLDIETAEDGETFFVNVVLEETKEDRKRVECFTDDEECGLWMERQENKTRAKCRLNSGVSE